MNLNHFESVSEATLNQILQTLDNIHGVKFTVDYENPNLVTTLKECKSSYETLRDKIINESAFNSYQTNPEYIKSMLVLEAVKLLIEIAPKRMKRRKMNENMSGQQPKATLAMQLSGIAAKVPNDSDASAAFANALSRLSDKLSSRESLDDQDREIISWLKDLPRPVSVNDIIHSGVDRFGEQLAQGADSNVKSWPGIPPSWMDKEKKVAEDDVNPPTSPVGTNPLQTKKIIPGQPGSNNNNDYRQNAIASIVDNHGKGLLSPDIAKKQLLGQGVNPADVDNVLNGRTTTQQGAPAPGTPTAQGPNPISGMEENKAIMRAKQNTARPGMGNVMEQTYDKQRKKLATALRMLNEFDSTEGQDVFDEDKANVIIGAKGIVSKIQDMAEDVAKLNVDDLMPLVDMMREQFGPEVSDGFNQTFKEALNKLLDLTTNTKDNLASAVDTLAKGGVPSQSSDLDQMGADDMTGGGEEGGDPFASDEDIMGDLNGPDGEGTSGDDLGDTSEPALGREKKDEIAEAKGKLPPWLKKDKNGKVTKADPKDKKGKTDKDVKGKVAKPAKKDVKESAPPGKKAEDFITSAKPDFKQRYGKDWEKRLYATAWKKFGESSVSYNRAEQVLAEAHRRVDLLTAKLNEHKVAFAKSLKEGKGIDPLGMGYGLEGEAINQKIRRLNKKIAEAKSIMLHEMQTGIKKLMSDIKTHQKVTAMLETRQKTPYGIMYKVSNGKNSLRMFESADVRDRWMELNQDTLRDYQMVNPETFDEAIKNLTR